MQEPSCARCSTATQPSPAANSNAFRGHLQPLPRAHSVYTIDRTMCSLEGGRTGRESSVCCTTTTKHSVSLRKQLSSEKTDLREGWGLAYNKFDGYMYATDGTSFAIADDRNSCGGTRVRAALLHHR